MGHVTMHDAASQCAAVAGPNLRPTRQRSQRRLHGHPRPLYARLGVSGPSVGWQSVQTSVHGGPVSGGFVAECVVSTVVGPVCTRGHQSADEFQCEGIVEGDSAVGEGCADCGEGDVGGGVGGVDTALSVQNKFIH